MKAVSSIMKTYRDIESIDSGFARRVSSVSDVNLSACFQCQKCTNGCPVTFAMDLYPDEVIRRVNLGHLDKVPAYLLRAAGRLRGVPHYIGLHCGGVVITPRAVTEYSHVQPSLAGYDAHILGRHQK